MRTETNFEKATLVETAELLSWIQKYYTYDHIAFQPEKLKIALALLLRDETYGYAYFIRVDEKRVGYFICTYGFDIEMGGRFALVTDLYFEESARRNGLGTATLTFIENEAKKRDLNSIELQVETDNHEAQAFYQKIGFEQLTRFSMSKKF
jgi:ribosomal protein S18 acetylase RimI-like enzyme